MEEYATLLLSKCANITQWYMYLFYKHLIIYRLVNCDDLAHLDGFRTTVMYSTIAESLWGCKSGIPHNRLFIKRLSDF